MFTATQLIDFFDDEDDLARCMEIAVSQLLPLIDKADEIVDPENKTKISTALFILFTYRAVTDHGLQKERAHDIIDGLFLAIQGGQIAALRSVIS